MRNSAILILISTALISSAAYNSFGPFRSIADWRAVYKTQMKREIDDKEYELFDFSEGNQSFLTVDFLKGQHFWHPQVAIWVETTDGEYLASLLVTKSTAQGIFYGGRTADNFKDFDKNKTNSSSDIRRVNALPHWSHQRNVKAKDGLYVPHPDEPLIDGITSATPSGNFLFKTKPDDLSALDSFVVKMEVNVAFDQNKFYSEYHYLEDEIYHSGTGLLGQPSLIYSTKVNRFDNSSYYLMTLKGHGHHSARDGQIYPDLEKITTAKKIVERILVKINW